MPRPLTHPGRISAAVKTSIRALYLDAWKTPYPGTDAQISAHWRASRAAAHEFPIEARPSVAQLCLMKMRQAELDRAK